MDSDCKINNVSEIHVRLLHHQKRLDGKIIRILQLLHICNDGKIKIGTKKESIREANYDVSISLC